MKREISIRKLCQGQFSVTVIINSRRRESARAATYQEALELARQFRKDHSRLPITYYDAITGHLRTIPDRPKTLVEVFTEETA